MKPKSYLTLSLLCACFTSSLAMATTPFCPGSSCTQLWPNKNSSFDPSAVNYTTHMGQNNVICSSAQSIKWTANNVLTIHYTRNTPNSEGHTCYVVSNRSLLELINSGKTASQQLTSLPPSGYLTADISLQESNPTSADKQAIWPAFWLNSNDFSPGHSHWPANGEIDIAERMNNSIHTNLIGDPSNPFGNEFMYANTSQDQKLGELIPNNGTHQYGFAWQRVTAPGGGEMYVFDTYFDGKLVNDGAASAYQNGIPNDPHDTTLSNVYKGFANMQLKFDIDDFTRTAPLNYSMTVSNVAIYQVNHPTPPCPAPLYTDSDSNQNGVNITWNNPQGLPSPYTYRLDNWQSANLLQQDGNINTYNDPSAKLAPVSIPMFSYRLQRVCANDIHSAWISINVPHTQAPATSCAPPKVSGTYSPQTGVTLNWGTSSTQHDTYSLRNWQGQPLTISTPGSYTDPSAKSAPNWTQNFTYYLQRQCSATNFSSVVTIPVSRNTPRATSLKNTF